MFGLRRRSSTVRLSTARLDTRRGRRAMERLEARGGLVVDRRIERAVDRLLADVRRRGDRALVRAVRQLDGAAIAGPSELRLPVPDAESERAALPGGFAAALGRAIEAVERCHRLQAERALSGFESHTDGVEVIEDRRPLGRVGVYIPGGRASYPSTVVMTVIPARIAGVGEIAVATPPATYAASAALRFTLGRLGIREVWGMGGAHAVAALAYGTATVPRVDAIVGPGNAWVTAAKRRVAGVVAIDGLAGPSEVVIVATAGADPEWIAADLLAQAEHDPQAAAVLVTTDPALPWRVEQALAQRLPRLATAATAAAALRAFGTALVARDRDEALAAVERLAPEHVQLVGAEAEALAPEVRNAGAVFVGAATPEAFGDYVAGPSHVLPTGGSARFASGLGVDAFVRTSHRVRFSPAAAVEWSDIAAALADAEGFPAHAASARLRSEVSR